MNDFTHNSFSNEKYDCQIPFVFSLNRIDKIAQKQIGNLECETDYLWLY